MEKVKQSIAMFLSDNKCERCSLRTRKTDKRWCGRCIESFHRAEASANSKAYRFINCVGDAYSMADISHIPFRDKIEAAAGDIYLWGSVGAGKTYAMAALIKMSIEQGYDCRRINFDAFCCRVRDTMNNSDGDESEYKLVQDMSNVDRLFIDDIGIRSKKETDFAYVTLYSILDKRQENLLPTYITTNKSIDQLAKSFDQRIASRLRTATIIHLDGEDLRLKHSKQ